MNINKKINCNAEFMLFDLSKDACKIGMKPAELVVKFRDTAERRGVINTWVMASKKMRREGALVGVGCYLRKE